MQLYNALFLKGTFANTGYIPIHLNLNEKKIFYYFAEYFHSNENVHITEIKFTASFVSCYIWFIVFIPI